MSAQIYDTELLSIGGERNLISDLPGKICLFTNIASKAGYEPKCSKLWSQARTSRQLWELQSLYETYRESGFVVIGVPCNQFFKMEPLTNEEIAEFISVAYPFVSFPISEKVEVNGDNEHPLFRLLKGNETRRTDDNKADSSGRASDGQNKAGQAIARIPSNYEKFITGRDGSLLFRFRFTTWPLATESLTNESELTIRSAIEMVL